MKTIRNFILTIIAVFAISASGVFAASSTDNDTRQLTNIEKKVRKELISASWDGVFDNLAFEVKGNTVTLYGQVYRPSTRTRAEKFVKDVEGVEQVINKIEVLPLSGFDDRIRAQSVRSINSMAGLYRYLQGTNPSLRIIVRNGHVTLEGIVSDETDRRLAFFAVNGIPGVFSVTNNLRTERGR
ncbi:MAG: BON domain-containing protein [Acidobacteriota bacterium]|nr:BON domain-containing protein [Acidobacteriota bacterium]